MVTKLLIPKTRVGQVFFTLLCGNLREIEQSLSLRIGQEVFGLTKSLSWTKRFSPKFWDSPFLVGTTRNMGGSREIPCLAGLVFSLSPLHNIFPPLESKNLIHRKKKGALQNILTPLQLFLFQARGLHSKKLDNSCFVFPTVFSFLPFFL